jgi:hypothetical protein
MKRTIKLLAWLYPSSWRKRYGAEFEALLEDTKPSFRDSLDIFWGALKMQLTTWTLAKIVVVFSIFGVLVAVGISLVLPKDYVLQSTIIAEAGDASSLLTAKRLIQQSAFDRQSLASIIEQCDLYPQDRGRISQDALVDRMSRHIRVISPLVDSARNGSTAIFNLQFDYPDAEGAQRVNAKLISLVMAGNLYARSNSIFRVLDPPPLVRMPTRPGFVRIAGLGLLAGLLVGLLLTGVIKGRTSMLPS